MFKIYDYEKDYDYENNNMPGGELGYSSRGRYGEYCKNGFVMKEILLIEWEQPILVIKTIE